MKIMIQKVWIGPTWPVGGPASFSLPPDPQEWKEWREEDRGAGKRRLDPKQGNLGQFRPFES